MMEVSDNMATDTIARVVGLESVNAMLDSVGLANIRTAFDIGRWHHAILGMADAERWPIGAAATEEERQRRTDAEMWDDANPEGAYSASDKNNVMSARDTVQLLQMLWSGALTETDAARAEMLGWMRNCTHTDTIGKYLAADVQAGLENKYGGSRRIASDVGIVHLPEGPDRPGGAVLIAAFAFAETAWVRRLGKERPDMTPHRDTLARMARLAVASVDPGAVVPLP